MQYEGWYDGLHQGAIACPEAPDSCAAPDAASWYADLFKPLGAPRTAATRSGNTWTREFEHAESTLNLDDPAASGVRFF